MRALIVVFVLALISPAFADELTLKNGDRLTGKVLGMSKGKLMFETPHSGTLTVDWAQVATLKTDGKVRVKLAGGEMLEGKLSAGEGGRLKIESETPAAPVEVELGKVTHLNEPPTQWHGSVTLSARTTDGNTHTTGFLLAAEGSRITDIDQFTLKAIFRYGDKSGEIQERNSYGLAKYQYFLTSDLYAYTSVELFSDTFKDLRLRTVVSAGAGYNLYKSAAWELAVEAGIAWFDNDFRDAEDESHLGGRLAAHVRVALPLGFDLVDDVTFYPNFEESQDWQLHNEATLSTSLGSGWTFKAGVITDYDNRPSPGIEKRDDIFFLGLGYQF